MLKKCLAETRGAETQTENNWDVFGMTHRTEGAVSSQPVKTVPGEQRLEDLTNSDSEVTENFTGTTSDSRA